MSARRKAAPAPARRATMIFPPRSTVAALLRAAEELLEGRFRRDLLLGGKPKSPVLPLMPSSSDMALWIICAASAGEIQIGRVVVEGRRRTVSAAACSLHAAAAAFCFCPAWQWQR